MRLKIVATKQSASELKSFQPFETVNIKVYVNLWSGRRTRARVMRRKSIVDVGHCRLRAIR